MVQTGKSFENEDYLKQVKSWGVKMTAHYWYFLLVANELLKTTSRIYGISHLTPGKLKLCFPSQTWAVQNILFSWLLCKFLIKWKIKVQDERWKSPSESQITHKGVGEMTVRSFRFIFQILILQPTVGDVKGFPHSVLLWWDLDSLKNWADKTSGVSWWIPMSQEMAKLRAQSWLSHSAGQQALLAGRLYLPCPSLWKNFNTISSRLTFLNSQILLGNWEIKKQHWGNFTETGWKHRLSTHCWDRKKFSLRRSYKGRTLPFPYEPIHLVIANTSHCKQHSEWQFIWPVQSFVILNHTEQVCLNIIAFVLPA